MKVKRVLMAVLVGGLICLLGITVALAQTKITLKYSFWGSVDEKNVHTQWCRTFEKMYPNVNFKTEHITANYEMKLLTEFAGGVAPDVIFFQDEPFKDYAARGMFLDLGPYLQKDPNFNPENLLPRVLEMFQYKGKQYGYPSEGGPITLYYNPRLFDEAGVAYPDKPIKEWNYDACIEAWRKLTQDINGDGKIDQFGTAMPRDYVYFEPFLWGFGASWFVKDDEGRVIEPATANIDTPEGIRALQWWQDIWFKYGVAPTPAQEQLLGGEFFRTGKVATSLTGPWMFMEYRAAEKVRPDFKWDVGYLPIGPAGVRRTRSSYDMWGINSNSKNPDWAYKFISFLASKEGQILVAKLGRAIPCRKEVAYSDAFTRPDTPQHEERFLDIVDNYAWIQPLFKNQPATNRAIAKWLDLLLLNKIGAAECAHNLQVDMNKALSGKE